MSETNCGLLRFEETLEYGHWYFGHYHIDSPITDKKTALYKNIVQIIG
ncbi:MAG: hypothetical protein LBU04_05400 [Christensenellaceae bacterium]|nr:hypothetical protein [Christensenellaceae bacterium]